MYMCACMCVCMYVCVHVGVNGSVGAYKCTRSTKYYRA